MCLRVYESTTFLSCGCACDGAGQRLSAIVTARTMCRNGCEKIDILRMHEPYIAGQLHRRDARHRPISPDKQWLGQCKKMWWARYLRCGTDQPDQNHQILWGAFALH